VVVLYEVNIDATVLELFFLKDFRKEATRIYVTNGLQQLDVRNNSFQNFHAVRYRSDPIGDCRRFT
jgi:hypothetical protein